ncbi:hypothetical protein CI610_00317 [invertebrate metagenome]|uniref:Lipoprotein n=1 Tax=invertebrate metagenome TaxID=1711999 RepID=A0A2H9TBN4_9ZZZZ
MKRALVVLLAVFLLGGCSTNHLIRYGINKNHYSLQPSNDDSYDYLVKLKRNHELNVDNSNTRLLIVKKLISGSCLNPVIINEHFVNQGQEFFGFERGTYFLKVSCQ